MKKLLLLLPALVLLLLPYSCTEDRIGSSLSATKVEVVGDSSFVVSGYTVKNADVPARTITQLLGVIQAANYGELHSTFVSQMMPAADIDTGGVTVNEIDSCFFIFNIPEGGFTGDSVTPMRASVYKLNKQLPGDITSSFEPEEYFSKDDLLGAASYTGMQYRDSSGLHRNIKVEVDRSVAQEMFRKFKTDPQIFRDPKDFAQYFPGIYVHSSFGSGRIMNILGTEFVVYYRKIFPLDEERDTTWNEYMSYLGATEEILSNNNLHLDISENVKNMVAAGDAIIQTPAAYEVRLKLPVQEILDKYKNNSDALTVFNSVSLEIPVEELENENNINPPQYLLLVPTAKKSEFLSKTNVPDNETSFYAQYDSQNKRYVFSEMRDYFIKILEERDGKADEEDSEFTLTPIDVVTDEDDEDSGSIYNSWYFYMMYGYYPQSSSSDAAVVDVKPAVERPSIVKLNLEDVKIRLYYSRMSVNN